ncbi:chemotaxis protein CheW [uncultured Abyssibacter sp.]|uniref:chemotaxis protein CheW n=1 Tax=uncultured Abyssibacter sp. TaxID=2320202 RepID=UPI0032B2A876
MKDPYDLTATLDAAQVLTFRLADEDYALPIGSVREVLEYTDITRVPKTPDFMRGVINIRGSVVPVVDLRLEFGMPVAEPTIDTAIIITEVRHEERQSLMGILVDSVREVLEIGQDLLSEAPPMGNRVRTDFIRHVARLEDRFLMVLEMDRVLAPEQLHSIAGACEPADAVAEPA